jgi:hypothetical protein
MDDDMMVVDDVDDIAGPVSGSSTLQKGEVKTIQPTTSSSTGRRSNDIDNLMDELYPARR